MIKVQRKYSINGYWSFLFLIHSVSMQPFHYAVCSNHTVNAQIRLTVNLNSGSKETPVSTVPGQKIQPPWFWIFELSWHITFTKLGRLITYSYYINNQVRKMLYSMCYSIVCTVYPFEQLAMSVWCTWKVVRKNVFNYFILLCTNYFLGKKHFCSMGTAIIQGWLTAPNISLPQQFSCLQG